MTHRERGLSGSVEWVILIPLVLLTVLGLIQVGLAAHGRTVASHAAIASAEHAALAGSTVEQARSLGTAIAEGAGMAGVTVEVTRGADEARAVVTGTMPTFFDVGLTRAREQATRPLERVTAP
ncbi:MAG: TadE/TadG family type IV pilus assembly protein [Propioniciclava sp.]|uniref:TadE/TadG family type IV pilus assembly protein n=1 Tax=Propioniciclava sp. TaxID=2038686 RepID=UPI0039E4EF0B